MRLGHTSKAGASITTGDGDKTPEDRGQNKSLVYRFLPPRYGINHGDLCKPDAIEVGLGPGAKPVGSGILLGQQIAQLDAVMRTLPQSIDQSGGCRRPDWTVPRRCHHQDRQAKGTLMGSIYGDFQEGRDPAGITSQAAQPAGRLDPVAAVGRLSSYLRIPTMNAQTTAQACGYAHSQHVEPECLVALTVEDTATARLSLAGTTGYPDRMEQDCERNRRCRCGREQYNQFRDAWRVQQHRALPLRSHLSGRHGHG